MSSTRRSLDDPHICSSQCRFWGTWPSPIGRRLEHLSVQIMEAYNGNIEMDDYLFRHIADSFVYSSGLPGVEETKESPQSHMLRMRQFFHKHPSWKVCASNPSGLVDEENGTATVFATSTISGYMLDLARERVSMTKWRCFCGQWKVVEHKVMVGGGLAPGY